MCIYSLCENPTENDKEKNSTRFPCKAAKFTRMNEIYGYCEEINEQLPEGNTDDRNLVNKLRQ